MDFTAAVKRLEHHAAEAGRALPNRITDVAFAHPEPKGSRCIRLYYDGEGATARLAPDTPRVLNGELVSERIVIVAFWALASGSETVTKIVDHEVRALKHQLRTRIQADSQLGGACSDLDLDYAEVDWAMFAGTRYRYLEMAVTLDFEEYTIAR